MQDNNLTNEQNQPENFDVNNASKNDILTSEINETQTFVNQPLSTENNPLNKINIEENKTTLNIDNIPTKVTKNYYKPLFYIFFLISIFSTGMLSFITIDNSNKIKTNDKEIVDINQDTQIISPTPTKNENNIDNLSIYKNSIYKVDYLSKFKVNDNLDDPNYITFTPQELDDSIIENAVISIYAKSRDIKTLNLSFSEFVKLKDLRDADQNYKTLDSVEKIIAKNGEIGYKVIWTGVDENNDEIQYKPKIYFDTKSIENSFIVFSILNEKYETEFESIASSFDLIDNK